MPLFALLFCMLGSALSAERAVTVLAAASLRGVLEDIATGFDGTLRLSFGGSGTMARQIAAGAPADVVVLANTVWMDWLADQGALAEFPPKTVARNALVVIGPSGAEPLASERDMLNRLGPAGRLAMGQRDAVPAGIYARQWLEQVALWDELQGKLAETDNVRAALGLVARGDTPLGIVYATDAQAEDAVKILWSVSQDQHAAILYPAAALTDEGRQFVDALTTPAVQAIFAAHGFRPVTR